MQALPFMTTDVLETLLKTDRKTGIRAVRDIVARFLFTNLGDINVDFGMGDEGDLIRLAMSAIKTASGHAYPVFPLSPVDYVCSAHSLLEQLPTNVLQSMWQGAGDFLVGQMPADREGLIADLLKVQGHESKDLVLWGLGAVGNVPPPYNSIEVYFKAPHTFWGVIAEEPYTEMEEWIIELERRIYCGVLIDPATGLRGAGDMLAERTLRAFYVEFILARVSQGFRAHARESVVWEATTLPLPHLAWRIRWIGRSCEGGSYGRGFSKAEKRERYVQLGQVEIFTQARIEAGDDVQQLARVTRTRGWLESSDPMSTFGNTYVEIKYNEQPVVVGVMFPGMIMLPLATVESVGIDGLQGFVDTAAAQLNSFGIYAQASMFLTATAAVEVDDAQLDDGNEADSSETAAPEDGAE